MNRKRCFKGKSNILFRSRAVCLITALTGFCPSQAAAIDQADETLHIALAQQDLAQGLWARSLARFRWLLLESNGDLQRQATYQNTISTITNEHPLRFSIGAALLPSSNITNGSSHTFFETDFGTFRIESAEDRKSGVGLHLSGSATYSHAYDRGRIWSVTASAASNVYKEEDLQMGQLGVSIAHEWLSSGQQTQLAFGIQDASYRVLSDRNKPDFKSKALTLKRNQKLNDVTWLAIDAQLRQFDYPDRSYNNGVHRLLYVTPRVSLGPQTSVSLKTGIQSVGTEAQHQSYQGKSLGLFLDRQEKNGLRWGIGIETHWRDYDADFPGLTVNRVDRVNDLHVSASHSLIQMRGMTPQLHCTFRDHGSNVALYDYRSTDCSLSLNHQF